MEKYITGDIIKKLREKKNMTQSGLADMLCVSDKAVSKWETGRSYPDITLLEPIAKTLGVSVTELLSGEEITNANRAGNMKNAKLYVCPVCGNVIMSMGASTVSCCGVALPPLEAESADSEHEIKCERAEDEIFVSVEHEMTRQHHISFIAYASGDRFEVAKLYPEGNAEARFGIRGKGVLYCYCNRDGLFRTEVAVK